MIALVAIKFDGHFIVAACAYIYSKVATGRKEARKQ